MEQTQCKFLESIREFLKKKQELFYPALTEHFFGQMFELVKPTHVTD